MRVVVLMKAFPGQPLSGDPFIECLTSSGIDVAGVICQRRSIGEMRSLFPRVRRRLRRLVARNSTDTRNGASSSSTLDIGKRINVTDHNGAECIAALKALQPDVILLRGTGIIRTTVLECAPMVFNVHYGPLPEVRGMSSIEWSLFLGLEPTITLHKVDGGVDTGKIILQRTVPLDGCITLVDLVSRADEMARELMRDGCLAMQEGNIAFTPNPGGMGRQYYRMHPFLREIAQRRLEMLLEDSVCAK